MSWLKRTLARTKKDENAEHQRYDVFVSYCRDDRNAVLRLRNSLNSFGLSVWIDSGIIGGKHWEVEIKNAIRNSRFYVLVLSQALGARHETYVSKELNWIFERLNVGVATDGSIIPVLLDCATFPNVGGFNFAAELRSIQTVSLTKGWNVGVSSLLTSIDHESGVVSELMNELVSSSARRRIVAARRLGDLGDSSKPALNLLRTLLIDDNETVQANAAVAIGCIGDADDQTIEALVNGLKCSQIDMGYGFPVFLSTLEKLSIANPCVLPKLCEAIDAALEVSETAEASHKLEMARHRVESWLESGGIKQDDEIARVSLEVSNAIWAKGLEIERDHCYGFTIYSRETGGILGEFGSHNDGSFSLQLFIGNRRYHSVNTLPEAVSMIKKNLSYS